MTTTKISISDRNEKIEKARALLSAAVGQLQTSDDWRKMLDGVARGSRRSIRRFSWRNQMLISMQKPDATAVATYQSWLRQGRQVRRGEKSMMVLAPIVVSKPKKENRDESDSKLVGFRVLPVFDASQTDRMPGPNGRPLPEPVSVTRDVTAPEVFDQSVEVLRSVALGLGSDVVTSIEVRPRQAGDHPAAHGWYEPATRRIVVISGETSRSQQFKTLSHELAHAILHGKDDHHARAEQEIEAESVAYVTAKVLGLEVGSYSFPYLCSWAVGKDAERMVMASGQRITKAVNVILDALIGSVSGEDQKEAA